MKILANHAVRFFICVSQPAQCLVLADFIMHEGKRDNLLIAILRNHLFIVQAASQASCRGSCFESAEFHAMSLEIVRKFVCRSKPVRPARKYAVADKYFSSEKCSGRKDDRFGCVIRVRLGFNSAYLSVLDNQVRNFTLLHIEVWFFLYRFLHLKMVFIFIRLCTQRMNCGSFCGVQHFTLDESFVNIDSHFTAECINFSYQMSFAGSSDGRIARHHCHCFEIDGEHQRFHSHPRRSKRGFASGMSCTDNDNIVFTH